MLHFNAMSMVLSRKEYVHAELERILKSMEFSSSPRLVRFLRYCVEQTCDGRLENLKESVIGVHVFDRDPSYDPKVDPIVRVQARRLREKLATFYGAEGSLDIVIEVPKGGYVARFIEAASPIVPEPVVRKSKSPPWTLLAALAALGLVFALFTGKVTRGDLSGPTVQPLVSLPGSANDPAWAQDGRSVAFTWDGGAEMSHIYVLKRGETVPGKLTESKEPEYRPAWSPEGTRIALLREAQEDHFSIVLADIATKTEQLVRNVVWSPFFVAPPALDWSSNGEWLVTSEMSSDGTPPAHLLLVSPKDGRSWVITDPPNGSTGDLEARFTPDSKRILFRRGGHGELFMLSLNGTTASVPAEVTHANAGIRGLSVSRDGKTIYFGSQQENDRFGIWRIRAGEKSPARITPENMAAISPAVDPLGHFLTFVQPMVDLNLWLYDARRSGEPRLLVPSTQAEYEPAFSPDGQKLAFVSDRSGSANIWISALNGGEPRKLTSLRPGEIPMWPSWSPDATRIAFFSRRDGVNYAYETDVAGGTTRSLRAGDDYSLFPHYSGDGKSLYFVSNAGNRFRIWRQSLAPNASAEPLIADDLVFFRTSKDWRYIYFLQLKPERLMRLNLATKEKVPIWTFTDSLGAHDAWEVAGNTLFYVSLDASEAMPRVVAVDLNSGERRVIGTFRRLSQDWKTSITASPDGASVVVTQVDKDDTKLMLMRLAR